MGTTYTIAAATQSHNAQSLALSLPLPTPRSNDIHRRLGGVMAIDELVDVKTVGDDTTKTTRLALLLHKVIMLSTHRPKDHPRWRMGGGT